MALIALLSARDGARSRTATGMVRGEICVPE